MRSHNEELRVLLGNDWTSFSNGDQARPATLEGNDDSDQKLVQVRDLFRIGCSLRVSVWGVEAWAPEAYCLSKCPCPTLDRGFLTRAMQAALGDRAA